MQDRGVEHREHGRGGPNAKSDQGQCQDGIEGTASKNGEKRGHNAQYVWTVDCGPTRYPYARDERASYPGLIMAVTVFDAHCDSLLRILIDGADLARFPKGQADLPRWKKGGFGA